MPKMIDAAAMNGPKGVLDRGSPMSHVEFKK